MATSRVSDCSRFVVLDDLHVDRRVFVALSRWAAERGMAVQDAIQLAACSLLANPAEDCGIRPPVRLAPDAPVRSIADRSG